MKNAGNFVRGILQSLIASLLFFAARAQQASLILNEKIAVVARPSTDSITLRWAPLNFHTWRSGHEQGYRIERYVMTRDGAVLHKPEKAILQDVLTPAPLKKWETSVAGDRYAAIAAQALFGERFEIDLSQTDLLRIVDHVRENEQRFAFALFSADMSPLVARLSGLWFCDTTARRNEKYLYRIVVNTMDSLRGSIYTSPDAPYVLSPPQHLRAGFRDQLVSLRWDKAEGSHYSAFIVERSSDGHEFSPVSQAPVATVTPASAADSRYEYAADSLRDLSREWYYRVRGLTPFGETGPPSDVVSVRAQPSVTQVPYISSADNETNASLTISWTFPESDNQAIKGFRVSRASHPKGNFAELTPSPLAPYRRMFRDSMPDGVNYYRVTAIGLDDMHYPSPLYFAQLIDSVAPAAPAGLHAVTDTTGVINLSWRPNSEQDLYGYRVYKSWHRSEELAQVTTEPIPANHYRDSLNINSLNETVCYSVMAIDNNQNHSPLSALLVVPLPDRVRPQPPVFRRGMGSRDGVLLEWTRGSSEDIAHYLLFRKSYDKDKWEQIGIFDALDPADSTGFHYLDADAPGGRTTFYTLVSVDDAGLESDPALPVGISRPDYTLHAAVRWKKPSIVREESRIILKWDHDEKEIDGFRLFKSVNHLPPILFKTVDGNTYEFSDVIIPGRHYSYHILALFKDGSTSSLSDALGYQY